MIVMSGDPGTKNFACSVAEYTLTKQGKMKVKFIGTGMIDSTLIDLTENVAGNLKTFRSDMKEIARSFQPRSFCFERFQSRGLKGSTIEAISFMLGALTLLFSKHDPKFILASTWKNRINAVLKSQDKPVLKEVYKNYGLTRVATKKEAHELDAFLIGMYKAHKDFGLTDFEYFKENDFDEFMEKFLESPTLNCK